MFSAISIDKTDAGYQAALRELDESELPDGDVTVRVSYSGLNYKDALAITGKAPVVRRFPMVPGIDLAGVVEHSDSPSYSWFQNARCVWPVQCDRVGQDTSS